MGNRYFYAVTLRWTDAVTDEPQYHTSKGEVFVPTDLDFSKSEYYCAEDYVFTMACWETAHEARLKYQPYAVVMYHCRKS